MIPSLAPRTAVPSPASSSRGSWQLFLPIAALMLCHFLAAAAPAQKKSKLEEVPQPKSWVAGYFITGLAITLGLVILCRPGTRTQEFRRTDEA